MDALKGAKRFIYIFKKSLTNFMHLYIHQHAMHIYYVYQVTKFKQYICILYAMLIYYLN